MEVHRKHVKMQSRSARSERILKNVNETKISNLSSFGYARSMENISEGYRSASPSELSTPTIMRPVSHRTRSQARSRSRNSKSVSVGVDANQFELMQYFISKQWLNRFLTFADPGPITNTDFLCQHNSKGYFRKYFPNGEFDNSKLRFIPPNIRLKKLSMVLKWVCTQNMENMK